MRSFKSLLLAAATVVGFCQAAQAGIHVEPFLGYSLSGDWKDGSTSTDYSGGPHLGARLGYGMMGFFIAGEYEQGSMTLDSSPEVDFDQTNMGLALGFEFPILLRVYGTYMFNAKADEANSNKYEGTGLKLGVGYTGLPFVAINFEMSTASYDELNGNTLNTKRETEYYTINVSLPLSL